MAKLGFIGLGILGKPMAGHSLSGQGNTDIDNSALVQVMEKLAGRMVGS